MSNLYGMLAARHHINKDIKTKGIHGSTRYAVFTSCQVRLFCGFHLLFKSAQQFTNIKEHSQYIDINTQ